MNAAQIGLQLAPTAIKGGLSLLGGGSKPGKFEKKINSMADMLETDLDQPLTESNDFKSGKRELDSSDKRNRESLANILGAGNVTNESKLAGMDDANESYAKGLNALLQNASRLRDRKKSRYLNLLGTAENAKTRRVNQYNQNLNSILQPLSQAGQAWAMSDLFASKEEE